MRMQEERGHDHMVAVSARRPRLAGLMLFAVGAGFSLANIALLAWTQRYYGALFIASGALIPLGAWIMVTGIVGGAAASRKPPLWWNVGAVTMPLVGVLAGIYVSIVLGK